MLHFCFEKDVGTQVQGEIDMGNMAEICFLDVFTFFLRAWKRCEKHRYSTEVASLRQLIVSYDLIKGTLA